MPNAQFVGLIQSILSSAEAVLGETYSPMTRHLARDGVLAKRTAEKALGLLEMLQLKTHGNLDETERDLLIKAVAKIKQGLARLPAEEPN